METTQQDQKGIKERIKAPTVTMACFRGNRKEFYGEVTLLDESRLSLSADSGLKQSSRAGQLLRQVCSHLGLDQSQFFGLKIYDNRQQMVWLDPDKTLSQHPELCKSNTWGGRASDS
ncbi:band 4.1-like protein 4 [Periophthalmus magnuspinnatus]|uniref:band 4.1-like protein 4 n=1 Tax=Periophthalmus magnuspinnatus TaxID=409849 RepID=UPI0024366A91|nr:band 4.1-like protein 4 [Periophthalmus magnuspinnatus]